MNEWQKKGYGNIGTHIKSTKSQHTHMQCLRCLDGERKDRIGEQEKIRDTLDVQKLLRGSDKMENYLTNSN